MAGPDEDTDVGEYLARLTPGAVNLEPIGGGSGLPGDSRAALKGALGTLPDQLAQLLLAKFCEDREARDQVLGHYIRWMRDEYAYQGGRLTDWAGGCAKVVQLAVAEACDPPRCRTCRGRGWVYRNRRALRVECPRCAGTLADRRSDFQRARLAGIDRAAWKRRWGPRFHHVARRIAADEAGALHLMRYALGWPRAS